MQRLISAPTRRTASSGSRQSRDSGIAERVLLLVFIVSYGAIGLDLLHSSVRSGDADNPFAEYYNRLRYVAIILSCVLFWLSDPQTRQKAFRAIVPAAPFVVAAGLSALSAEELLVSARYIVLLVGLIIGAATITARIGLRQVLSTLLQVIAAIMVLSTVLAVLAPGIGRHSAQDMLELGHVGRWRGIFGHKNALGSLSAVGAPLLFILGGLLRGPKFYLHIARWSALACLVMSGSSNALIGAGALASVLLTLRMASNIRPGLVFAGIILAAVVMTVLSDFIAVDLLGKDVTFSGRTMIWAAVLEFWQQKPVFGLGYGSGSESIRPLLVSMLFLSAVDAHSGYLHLLLESGVVGITAFLYLMLKVVVRALDVIGAPDHSGDIEAVQAAFSFVFGCAAMAIGEVAPFAAIGIIGCMFHVCAIGLLTVAPPMIAHQPLVGKPASGQPVTGKD